MSTFGKVALWSRASKPLRLFREIHHRICVARSRRALRRLDDHILRDIGLTRRQAEDEADRAYWDAPTYWRR